MQAVIERVMETYRLLVPLSAEQEAEARERVTNYLSRMQGDDNVLAVAGLRFLRTPRKVRTRSAA